MKIKGKDSIQSPGITEDCGVVNMKARTIVDALLSGETVDPVAVEETHEKRARVEFESKPKFGK